MNFQKSMVGDDLNYLPKRKACDEVLGDKGFNIAKNPKHDGYQQGLASIFHNGTKINSKKQQPVDDYISQLLKNLTSIK